MSNNYLDPQTYEIPLIKLKKQPQKAQQVCKFRFNQIQTLLLYELTKESLTLSVFL
jgi:hypothetical protein